MEERAYARGRADGYKDLRLSYSCAHCGCFAKVPATDLDGLDAGTTLRCSECGGATVVDLFRPEDRAELYRAKNAERATVVAWLRTRGYGTLGEPYQGLADQIAAGEHVPNLLDLREIAPGITGGVPSEDFVREKREEEL